MNTRRTLLSVVSGLVLTGSLAIAAPGHDQTRSKTKVRAAKQTTTMTTSQSPGIRTRHVITNENTAVRTRQLSGRRTAFVNGQRTVFVGGGRTVFVDGGSSFGFGFPSFGFGYPYYPYGYYPYYGYGYPYDYSYGYYSRPGYGYNGSVVAQVQSRLARAGYYHGPIDGVMGPRTHYAIRAYERDHGLRADGTINGPLLRNMGLRY